VRQILVAAIIADDLAQGVIHIGIVPALRGGALPPGAAAVTVKAVLELFNCRWHKNRKLT
jgi:hypothetical protein